MALPFPAQRTRRPRRRGWAGLLVVLVASAAAVELVATLVDLARARGGVAGFLLWASGLLVAAALFGVASWGTRRLDRLGEPLERRWRGRWWYR